MSEVLARYLKDPDSVLDYTWDWSAWLGGDAIVGAPVIAVPTGLTKDSETNTASTVTVWLSGGSVGQLYDLTCRITTLAGRTDDRTIQIEVRHR